MAHSSQGAALSKPPDFSGSAAPCSKTTRVRHSGVSEILTYWLIPAEPARSYFRSLIQDFARRFDAPIFEPHLTLYTTEPGNEAPARMLRETFRNIETPHLFITAVKYLDEFTKTLFVEFRPDQLLVELSRKLRAGSALQSKYELNPHVSLLYKTISRETKADLANSLQLPFDEVRFDLAKAVISPAKIEAGTDIEAWRVVAEENFAG